MIDTENITKLIWLKQEGPYWDFKRQWYVKGHEDDMLHDILCMANNLENRDAYIIIGVDEETDYSVVDVRNDPYRRNTQKLVDFLREKKFAGDVRPVVTVESIILEGKTLDVIVIYNSNNTPFFLKERFNRIPSANIYTRIQDTNTPIDKVADISNIEYLWKKRFGLLMAPLERIKILLQDKENWEYCTGFDTLQYYKYAPEFTIGYPLLDPDERTGYEFYMLNQTNKQPHWTIIQLKYHQTILKEIDAIMLDGGRHFTPVPQLDGISLKKWGMWDLSYRYFNRDSLEYCIHDFYYNNENREAVWSDNRLMENVLLFDTEDEHQLFNFYIEQNWETDKRKYSKDVNDPYIPELKGYNVEHFKEEIINAQILKKMLSDYRRQ